MSVNMKGCENCDQKPAATVSAPAGYNPEMRVSREGDRVGCTLTA